MPTILKPHHTGIQVADLERSVAFKARNMLRMVASAIGLVAGSVG